MDPKGTRTPNPQPSESSGDETTVAEMPPLSPEGNNRRNFLKAAVVASAAVAAAGGAAGAALLSSRAPAPLIRFIGHTQSGDPCEACIEYTNYSSRQYITSSTPLASDSDTLNNLNVGFTINQSGNADGEFWLWFVDHAPLSGTVNLAIYDDNSAFLDNSTLFAYTSNTSASHPVLVTVQATAPTCPGGDSTSLGWYLSTLGEGGGLVPAGFAQPPDTGGIAYTQRPSFSDDVLAQIHLRYIGPALASPGRFRVFQFTFNWTDSGGSSCTKYLYIKAQQTN